ncbi:hypothetical protein ACJGE4_15590 [Bacillus velezensis]|uniref:hypothetical protein n=1 Tax=Bacillus velezensis TaxID=492670 RepID=UPI000C059A0E|nr:hypothetical protein [Bacillus velezensis]ATO08503.1 hypothetical protein CRH11_00080 [Bacillus velezensis]ATO12235.1 hypothetical protein CRH11_20535 [Bacillus velezensis]
MNKAKASVGDLIKLTIYGGENYPEGSVLRVHKIIDMSPIREKIANGEYDREYVEINYPEGTTADEVTAFPTWVRMDVNIHEECFGRMFFLENEDYEVLTEEEKEVYLKRGK